MNHVKVGLFCLALLVFSAVHAQLPSDGLVAFYPFNGDAVDSTGSGNDGVVTNATLVRDRFETADAAYTFSNGNITVTKPTGLPVGNAVKSISIWFKGSGNPTGSRVLFSLGANDTLNHALEIAISGGKFVIWNNNIDKWETSVVVRDVYDSHWHNFVLTYDSVTTNIYMDGIWADSSSDITFATYSNDLLVIGKGIINQNQTFRGSLDDIAIYDRVLDTTDVVKVFGEKPQVIKLVAIESPTTELRPIFSWFSVAEASTYTIKIGTTKALLTQLIQVPVSDTFYMPLIDLPVQTIYWQVTSDNGARSDIGLFEISDGTIPILIPFDPKLITNKRPTFKWYSVEGAANYTIEIDDNINFQSIIITTPISDTFYSPLLDLPNTTIYWRVKSDLNSNYSEIESVIILSDTLPILNRYNGDSVANNRPIFSWLPVTGATSYRIELDSVGNFNNPFISVPLTDTAYISTVDLNSGVVFWRVSSDLASNIYSIPDRLVIVDATNGISYKAPTNKLLLNQVTFSSLNDGKINIKLGLSTNSPVHVSMFSIKGQLINRQEFQGQKGLNSLKFSAISTDRAYLSHGMYLIKIRLGNSTTLYKNLFIR